LSKITYTVKSFFLKIKIALSYMPNGKCWTTCYIWFFLFRYMEC